MNIELIKWFIKEREAIRNGKVTEDYVLSNSRFCNIHREHDKVSKWIFTNCGSVQQVLIARLINRIDLLDHWKSLNFDTNKYLTKEAPYSNSGAYQFYPKKGETIQDIFIDIEKNKQMLEFFIIADSGSLDADKGVSIKELVLHLSKSIDRSLHFYFMMVVLDCAQMGLINNQILETEPYMGPGGKPILKALNTTLEELSLALRLPMYDIEHILCEVRKYVERNENGIPNNRKRI